MMPIVNKKDLFKNFFPYMVPWIIVQGINILVIKQGYGFAMSDSNESHFGWGLDWLLGCGGEVGHHPGYTAKQFSAILIFLINSFQGIELADWNVETLKIFACVSVFSWTTGLIVISGLWTAVLGNMMGLSKIQMLALGFVSVMHPSMLELSRLNPGCYAVACFSSPIGLSLGSWLNKEHRLSLKTNLLTLFFLGFCCANHFLFLPVSLIAIITFFWEKKQYFFDRTEKEPLLENKTKLFYSCVFLAVSLAVPTLLSGLVPMRPWGEKWIVCLCVSIMFFSANLFYLANNKIFRLIEKFLTLAFLPWFLGLALGANIRIFNWGTSLRMAQSQYIENAGKLVVGNNETVFNHLSHYVFSYTFGWGFLLIVALSTLASATLFKGQEKIRIPVLFLVLTGLVLGSAKEGITLYSPVFYQGVRLDYGLDAIRFFIGVLPLMAVPIAVFSNKTAKLTFSWLIVLIGMASFFEYGKSQKNSTSYLRSLDERIPAIIKNTINEQSPVIYSTERFWTNPGRLLNAYNTYRTQEGLKKIRKDVRIQDGIEYRYLDSLAYKEIKHNEIIYIIDYMADKQNGLGSSIAGYPTIIDEIKKTHGDKVKQLWSEPASRIAIYQAQIDLKN